MNQWYGMVANHWMHLKYGHQNENKRVRFRHFYAHHSLLSSFSVTISKRILFLIRLLISLVSNLACFNCSISWAIRNAGLYFEVWLVDVIQILYFWACHEIDWYGLALFVCGFDSMSFVYHAGVCLTQKICRQSKPYKHELVADKSKSPTPCGWYCSWFNKSLVKMIFSTLRQHR